MVYFVHPRWIGFRLLLAIAAGSAMAGMGYGADAAAANKSDSAIELPPFLVEEDKHARPWVYLATPGHEILSRCSDDATIECAKRDLRLEALLALILPRQFQFGSSVPRTTIMTAPTSVSSAARDVVLGEGAASPTTDQGNVSASNNRGIHFLPNLALEDLDASELFAIFDENSNNATTLVYTPLHVQFLLRRCTPALPPWFMAGFLRLFDDMTFRKNDIKIDAFTWISSEMSETLQHNPKAAPPLTSLPEMFALATSGTEKVDAAQTTQLVAQAAMFIRWALDDPHRREALWEFVTAATKAPIDDAVTTQCFGCNLAELQRRLTAYLPTAVATSFVVRLEKEPPELDLKVRDATPAEIGRILGDWERLEIRFVAKRHPEYVPMYLTLAHKTLDEARRWAPNDPGVCGIVGLLECDMKDDVMARPFLETAVAGRIDRPRVYYELARIRHRTALEHPAGMAGRLSADQANSILAPLAIAHRMEPPLVDAYTLTGRVWAESRADIQPANLAILENGVTLFPTNLRLLFLATVLEANYGTPEKAVAYAEQGSRASVSQLARDHFAMLRAAILANPRQRFDVAGPEPDESPASSAAPGDDKAR